MVKPLILTAAALALSSCTTLGSHESGDGILRLNPASLAADPARWDGRQVEVVGFLVWEFENAGLYQSYGAYCRGAEKAAVYVAWNNWPGVSRSDSRRRVIVRGVFRNRQGAQPGGTLVVSNAAAGPGPLEPGYVVGWLSKPAKPCPRALP